VVYNISSRLFTSTTLPKQLDDGIFTTTELNALVGTASSSQGAITTAFNNRIKAYDTGSDNSYQFINYQAPISPSA